MPSFNFKSIFKASVKFSIKSSKKKVEFIENFSLAEYGSALDMLIASELTNNKNLKKGYLDHALDEFRHADLFKEHAIQIANKFHFQYDKSSSVLELGEKIRYLNFIGEKPIYSDLNELEFINFVMISEKEAEKYFISLSESEEFDDDTRKLFKKIALEEREHVLYAKKELEKRKKKKIKGLKKAYFFIKWFRFKTDLLSNSRKIWVFLGNQLLNVIYLCVLPFAKFLSKIENITEKKEIDPYSMI